MNAEMVGIDTSSQILLSTEVSLGQGDRKVPSHAQLTRTLCNRILANWGGTQMFPIVNALAGPKSIPA